MLTFDSIFEYSTGLKLYKILHMNSHEYFARNLVDLMTEHRYETRFNLMSNLNIPFFSKSKCQNCFMYQAVKLWNRIPVVIRNAPSLGAFKSSLKKYLISQQ